jgi:hypothetical protein
MSTNQLQGYAKDFWNAAPDKQKKANILQIWNLTARYRFWDEIYLAFLVLNGRRLLQRIRRMNFW